MKNKEKIFEVTGIENKYVFLAGVKEEEMQVPKYRLPLQINIGTKLVINEFGMYQIYDSNT